MIGKVLYKLMKILRPKSRFDETGERVDISFTDHIEFNNLDMYQKSHLRRYEFALTRLHNGDICGDFACGTGYGSIMLSKKCKEVIGIDLSHEVIRAVKKRYKTIKNVIFLRDNLININIKNSLDIIVSFETIEHFEENNILNLLGNFNNALKTGGRLILSTPYLQEKTENAIKMGHHLTFHIDETKIQSWLHDSGFADIVFHYQNYNSHQIESKLVNKDFIICEAKKIRALNG